MKFSLILPTYKVAKYITACLESCCNQTGISPKEYEIIIVNDETPDDSIEIAQKVIDRYPKHNWKIINRKNGGLSAARNSGILEAKGDYLWFIDSDDFIEVSALSILSDIISQEDFDIVNFTHKTVYKNNKVVGGDKTHDSFRITGKDYLASTKFLSACTCLYRRNFITKNNLQFKEGVIWEDSEFNTRAYLLTDNCYSISNALYYYIRRENSISDSKATSFSTSSRISNAYDLDMYFSSSNYTTQKLGIAYAQIASMLIAAIAGLPELENKDRQYFRKEIRKHKFQYLRILYKCNTLRSKLILFVFIILPLFCEKMLNKKIHEAIKRSSN